MHEENEHEIEDKGNRKVQKVDILIDQKSHLPHMGLLLWHKMVVISLLLAAKNVLPILK